MGLAGGAVMLLAITGVIVVVLFTTPPPSAADSDQVEETIKPSEPQEYRVVNLPEETRRRIYDDYRTVARTSVEAPLALPQSGKLRRTMEGTLEGVFERELARFAALHDITVDDVKEVIKEGDAKGWDPSPRSNAVRGGKRVYPKEKSEGWRQNQNRK